jgi:tetratricopeptide (TPR) repeat protein
MNTINDSEIFKNIIYNLNNKKFNEALEKLKILSIEYPNDNLIIKMFASVYFQKRNWQDSIDYYKKTLSFENEKFKTYNNIGVAFFNLGKINKSIESFKNSINENPNFDLAYNNLGISYSELGIYRKAIDNFIYALNFNKNNHNAKKNLINTFLVLTPENINDHPLIKVNSEINKIGHKVNSQYYIQLEEIKEILSQSENLINNINDDIYFNETQIFRKNSTNLNCDRHFKVFNKFNVIPKYCFACYKVQINLNNVVDLIKLFFIFSNLHLENNNIRKCITEIRNNIEGNYKGYIYCNGLIEANKVYRTIKKIIDKIQFKKVKILIKHGCSEFYKSYPGYQNINFDGMQQMTYNNDWKEKETLIDKTNPIRTTEDKKIFTQSTKGINLSDILIIKNWINYAEMIGDYSYKKIYNKKITPNFINNILRSQLNFRKKSLLG